MASGLLPRRGHLSILNCITSLITLLQIFQEIEKLESDGKSVVRFSVTGYSLGGLLARYVVGCVLSTHSLRHLTGICPSSILHQRNFFATVTPVNFNTVATPHIGLLRYPSLFSKLGSFFGPRVLSRTGEQFYATDKWSKTGKALLEVMADPGEEPSLSRNWLADSQSRARVL